MRSLISTVERRELNKKYKQKYTHTEKWRSVYRWVFRRLKREKRQPRYHRGKAYLYVLVCAETDDAKSVSHIKTQTAKQKPVNIIDLVLLVGLSSMI